MAKPLPLSSENRLQMATFGEALRRLPLIMHQGNVSKPRRIGNLLGRIGP
jgi:hypothetical protein